MRGHALEHTLFLELISIRSKCPREGRRGSGQNSGSSLQQRSWHCHGMQSMAENAPLGVSGKTSVTSRHEASPDEVAPYATKSRQG